MFAVGAFELRLRSNRLSGDLPQSLSFLPLEVRSPSRTVHSSQMRWALPLLMTPIIHAMQLTCQFVRIADHRCWWECWYDGECEYVAVQHTISIYLSCRRLQFVRANPRAACNIFTQGKQAVLAGMRSCYTQSPLAGSLSQYPDSSLTNSAGVPHSWEQLYRIHPVTACRTTSSCLASP